MNRNRAGRRLIFAIAPCVAFAGLAIAQAAAGAAPALASGDALGADVVAAVRQWEAGDAVGRRTLEDMARAGRADAQEMLGEALFRGGFSGPPDQVSACRYFLQASASRRDALHNLAHCAESGVGGKPDYARAAQLYRQATEKGYPKSMCALGNLYIAGKGVPKDAKRGADLCRQGAEAGDEDAQTDLGNQYVQGIGVPHDIIQARHWYELAAAKGQANAEFVLGQIYWNGDGVARDQAKAAELWKAAYRGGRVDAAPLLAHWTFAQWMAVHRKGDFALLDEAIAWEQVSLKSAPNEDARGQAGDFLKLMRDIRNASGNLEK